MAKNKTDKSVNAPVNIEDLQAQIVSLQGDNEALQKESKDLASEYSAKIKDLTEQNEALKLEKDTLEGVNDELREENESLTDELYKLKVPVKPVMTKEDYLKNRKTVTIKGKVYAFSFKVPKTLSINGKTIETDELIKDEEAMEELIVGNAPFIELVN